MSPGTLVLTAALLLLAAPCESGLMRQVAHEYAAGTTPKSEKEEAERLDGMRRDLEQLAGELRPLYAELEGIDPDSVAIHAMRACGWEIKPPDDSGNV